MKSLIVRTRRISGKQLIADIVTAIALTAFLLAADYFTDKPSVEARIWVKYKNYYISFVKDFFRDNQIDPPPILTKGPFSNILEESDQTPEALTHPHGPLVEYIREGLRRDGYEASDFMITYRTNQLEEHFDSSRYRKHVYMGHDFGHAWSDSVVTELLSYVQDRSSPMEYLTFLAAVISSRTYRQQINVKNDGDVDLRDLDLTVPAPVSRLSQRRDGNILYYRPMGDMLYDIEQYNDRITLHIPRLKQGQFFGLEVLTRENELMDTDLLATYKSDHRFSLVKVCIYAIGILMAQWVIRWWCRGRPSVPDAR